MPPPGSDAAGDGSSAPSRTAIIGTSVTGSHLIEIEGYSLIKEQIPTGSGVGLRPFSVGGHYWQLKYYPNNEIGEYRDFICVSIQHLRQGSTAPDNIRSTVGAVNARVTLSLLDQAGEPVLSRTQTTGLHDFSYTGTCFHDFIKRAWLEESEYLVDDRFTVRCDVMVPLDVRTEERRAESPPAAVPPSVEVPPSDLHQHLGGLLATEEGADVTFQVAGETFSAHRCVLAARSPVFKAELFGAMRESNGTTVIRVDDIEAEVFRALLGFVYTDTLEDGLGVKQQKEAAMAQHLLVAADRYSLHRLKLICEDKLCKHIDTGSAATILALAEQHNSGGLKKACLQFLSSPVNLNDVMATEGFEHLARSCPSVLKELISNVPTRVAATLGEARQGVSMGQHEVLSLGQREVLSSGRRTNYWYQVIIVLIVLCAVLYLKGGSAPLSCFCLVALFFVGIIHLCHVFVWLLCSSWA